MKLKGIAASAIKVRWVIITLFALNIIFGLLFINEGLFHHDSIVLAQSVETTYKTGILHPAVRGRYGAVIINLILYFPFFIMGQNADFAVRFSSVLFHSLSIVVLFLFIKELFGDNIQASFTALLFSFNPIYFSPNTYGKEHGLSLFFLLLSFYLLFRGLKNKSYFLISIASFLIAFSITVRETMLIMVPLFFLLYFQPQLSIIPLKISFSKDRFNPKLILCAFLPFIVSFAFITFKYFKYVIYEALFERTFQSSYFLGFFSPVIPLALWLLFLYIPFLLLSAFIIGIIIMIYEKKSFYLLFFTVWFLYIFYIGNNATFTPRYLDIVIIPILAFASFALSRLYVKYRIVALGIVAYSVLSMFSFMCPMLEFRHHYNGEKQFALYVKDNTENNAIIIAEDSSPFIEYYGKRKTVSYPVFFPERKDVFIQLVHQYLNGNIPVYLVDGGSSYPTGGVFKKAISDNFGVVLVGGKLSEYYHGPEFGFQLYKESLFRINQKIVSAKF